MNYDMRRFVDKTVIITGAAGGIGLAAAERLAAEGANLTLVDMTGDGLARAKEKILVNHPETKILLVEADVTKEYQVRAYVDKTVGEFGAIDGFFNNAGIDGGQYPLADYTKDLFDKVVDINLDGVFLGLKYVLQQMVAQGHGRVVNTASIGGLMGWPHQYGYVASKHAVAGLTKATAGEMGPKGITINAIAPGGVKTAMAIEAMRTINPEHPEEAEAAFAARVPLKRMALPEEIAAVAAFLLSEDASYINAQIIAVDGGQISQS